MYAALYRQERPETFKEVVGQEHIVKVLKNQVDTGTVGHAYLFCGTRGTGKTTLARILAKAVNCIGDSEDGAPCGTCANCQAIKEGSFIDVIEMDAASNRGIDDAREIRESTNYPPVSGRNKVYIIDEAHMLTVPAFNALLKTLEEPPENVILILATTDPQKVPQTILSRCQRLDFKRVSHDKISQHMKSICDKRGIEIDDNGLSILATNADGSMRDGLSLLEQCLATGETHITGDLVLEFLGITSQEFFIELTDLVINHRVGEGLINIGKAVDSGKDTKQLMKDWMAHYRNLMLSKYIENPEDVLNMSTDNVMELKKQSDYVEMSAINSAIMILAEAISDSRYSSQPRVLLELALVKIGSRSINFSTTEETFANGKATISESLHKSKSLPAKSNDVSLKNSVEKVDVEDSLNTQGDSNKATMADEENQDVGKKAIEYTEADYEDLWMQICQQVTSVKPSVGTLRNKARLVEIGDNYFHIQAETKSTKDRLEAANQILSEIATVVIGRPVSGKFLLENEPTDKKSKNINQYTIDVLSNMFGDAFKVE